MGNRINSLPRPQSAQLLRARLQEGGNESREIPVYDEYLNTLSDRFAKDPPKEEEPSTYRYNELATAGAPVVYASPFLLKVEGMEKYFRAGYRNVCLVGTTLDITSLMTFHGPHGEQKNKRGNKSLICVKNNDVVTLYANIAGGGRYLSAKGSLNRRNPALAWTGETQEVKHDSREYEFYVRVATSAPKVVRQQEVVEEQNKTPRPLSRSLLNFRASRSLRRGPRYSSMADKRVSKRPLSMYSKKHRNLQQAQQAPVNYDDVVNSHVSDVSDSEDEEELKHGETESDIEEQTTPGSKQQGVQASQTTNSSEVHDLKIGDIVYLESKSRPGYYIKAMTGSNMVHLSRTDRGQFEIAAPELRHLVKLSGTRGSRMINPREAEKEVVVLRESEKQWLRLLQEIPLDIVYRILQFRGNWVRTARLVCKQWCSAAELHVRRIRVNGEFELFHQHSQRLKLFNFVSRCRYLQWLTLRNVDDLFDEDLSMLWKNRFLIRLSCGGCTGLTDEAISHIGKCENLTHLNVAVSEITDAGLTEICAKLPKLQHLNLYACENVTLQGIHHVLNTLQNLHDINIRGCNVDYVHDQTAAHGVQVLTGPLHVEGIYS